MAKRERGSGAGREKAGVTAAPDGAGRGNARRLRREARARPRHAALAALVTPTLIFPACEQTTVSVLEVASVEVMPEEITLHEGDRETMQAVLRERGGGELTGRSVSWSVDDPEVADIDDDGVLEARSPGTTLVRAAAEGVQGSAEVSVLPGPRIGLSPPSVTLEGSSGRPEVVEAQVQVENAGGGTLDGLSTSVEAPGSVPWLQAELGSGSAPTTLVVRASAEGLSPGTYEAAVSVTSPSARNAPVELDVRFEVAEPPPVIRVDAEAVDLSARSGTLEPATQTVRVENAGGGTLAPIQVSVRHVTGSGWLQARAQSVAAPTDVVIEASARFLVPGEYHGVVEISSPSAANESIEVEVTFQVEGFLWP
jgi:hypothetical protein